MSDQESIFGLFAELGPVLVPDAILAEADVAAWSVLLSDGTLVNVALQQESRCLTFTVPVGPLPETTGAELSIALLQMGFRWRQMGTMHAGLDDTGEVSLVYRHPIAALSVQDLARIVEGLAKRRAIVADAMETTDAAFRRNAEDSIGSSHSTSGFRV